MTQKGFKRKLTAILSADAVGYSRLMGEDEAATVRTLTAYHLVTIFFFIFPVLLIRCVVPGIYNRR